MLGHVQGLARAYEESLKAEAALAHSELPLYM